MVFFRLPAKDYMQFVFNPKSLRFERAGIPWGNWLLGLLALLAFTVLFFFGIAWLDATVWETPEEIALRKENQALASYYQVVAHELKESKALVSSIAQKDEALKSTLFDAILHPTEETKTNTFEPGKNTNDITQKAIALQQQVNQIKEKAIFNSAYFSEHLHHHDASINYKLLFTPSIIPVENASLASGFGKRIHPFHKGLYHHTGIDLLAPKGSAVMATASGTVNVINNSLEIAGYGNYIEISHGNGFITRYAHLENILVKKGQQVTKGQTIGTVGNTGGSAAPHLHYEVLVDGLEQNPIYYLLQGLNTEAYEKMLTASKKQNQALD